jgi:hypothetical protein
MCELVAPLLACKCWQDFSAALPCCLDSPVFGFSQDVFELCKDLFDRLEIGTVGGQEQQPRSCGPDRLANDLALMTCKIIHDYDVALFQTGHQNLIDIKLEAFSLDRAIKDARRCDCSMAQGRQEGHGFPVTLRNMSQQPLPFAAPSPDRSQVGFGPGLSIEHQVLKGKTRLQPLP